MNRHFPWLLIITLVLQGCTLGPDFQPPKAELGEKWCTEQGEPGHSQPAAGEPEVAWWEGFADPQLSALMRQVQAGNLDLQRAASRLQQSRAARRSIAADELPRVDGAAGYSRARNSRRGLSDPSGENGRHDYSLWSAGLGVSWEADLWGRVKRSVEAADANVQVAEEDRRAVLVAILAETARDYIQLRALQNEQAVTRQNLEIARRTRTLTHLRRAEGVTTELEVAQATAQVATIEAQLPALQQGETRLINALSRLMGLEPQALAVQLRAMRAIPVPPASVPIGLPSELARRRPDIRRAEADLHAATAAIGMAQADFYPRISLSGNLGFQALQLSDLGSWGSRTLAVGPSLSVPLFEGGRLQGQLQLRESRQQEAALRYRQIVLDAWHEVDDALSAYQAGQRRRDRLREAVEQSRLALNSARQQYAQGTVDFLNVLTVQGAVLANEDALVDSTAAVSLALVGLYSALGGGWEQVLPEQAQH
ncbi:efflux transporter outer membrane subunit [Pseudomonas vanderleydeniana]|uniref:Efflux transporter outer membrane subunit n=1 Tax=Pseudomonas vanderleydeniana TaxID=2745495 RepID=A0A9E6TTG8_9PSED|nr:efflux transporter outer membrane subunit [Pseudomonas vanderleydeniana]QXI30673.1 efflux transporter outer membrane subunit [Pseudomonas vanderleydeniana]